MTAGDGPPLGDRVAQRRRRLGLSQVELAARVNRSESWVSQVERGTRSIDRLSVRKMLADALGVDVTDLWPAPADAAAAEPPRRPAHVDALRLLLSGRPALMVELGAEEPVEVGAEEAAAWAEECWELAEGSRYRELADRLDEIVPALERAVRAVSGSRRRHLQESLTAVYLAMSTTLARLDQPDAAWVAAERAAANARELGNPAVLAGTQWRLALGLLITRRLDQARHVATSAVQALRSLVTDDTAVDLLSVWGALHLVLAMTCARQGQRSAAREHLALAGEAADRVGDGRNELTTEFGPNEVAAHAVAAAVELGDAGEALERAEALNVDALPAERRARVLLDIARAQDQLRRPADALKSLQVAEAVAPEQIRDHPAAHDVIRSLLQHAGRRPGEELTSLAERLGVR